MKDLIVQLFSTMFPILLYQMFWDTKGKAFTGTKRNKMTLLFICSLSIWLCMTFPISILNGYLYDLRDVPLIIGILYGGPKAGLMLTMFMIGYRFFLDGDGFYLTLISHAIILP
jgi:two-component system, sporulation sensor kinase B